MEPKPSLAGMGRSYQSNWMPSSQTRLRGLSFSYLGVAQKGAPPTLVFLLFLRKVHSYCRFLLLK